MERERIIQIGPVCRFGPGGDYVTIWPAVSAGPAEQPQNALTGVLNVLAGLIDALRGHKIVARLPSNVVIEGGSGPVTCISSNDQMMLFDDDTQAGQTIKYRTHHRIRATVKKRACITFIPSTTLRTGETRTLFDAESEIAKTA
jgi:hypothetical protein